MERQFWMHSFDNFVIQKALETFYEDRNLCVIPDSLPLVEEFCEAKLASGIFADLDVLFIQHHLGPFIPRVRALFDYGLEASRCWFVDIPYSTNSRVRGELKNWVALKAKWLSLSTILLLPIHGGRLNG